MTEEHSVSTKYFPSLYQGKVQICFTAPSPIRNMTNVLTISSKITEATGTSLYAGVPKMTFYKF